jgi:RHS repeat-associated protein
LRSFDAYGELESAGGAAFSFALSRDIAGRITSRDETAGAVSHAWTYAYDALGRLTSATRDGSLAESYAYDAQGNRTSWRAPVRGIDATVSATFDAEDRIEASDGATYAWSADGGLASKTTSAGVTAYSWTGLGELDEVSLPGGRTVSYRYDAHGNRVARLCDGAVTERYEWAGPSRPLAVYGADGSLLARFLYADARTPYAADTPGGRRYLSYDQAGSLAAVTDATGTVLRRVERDSFGNTLTDTAPGVVPWLGFAGGMPDAETGLVHFGARDYDPALGRWVSKDPIGFAGGDADLFAYCGGDPVGAVDPSGLYGVGSENAPETAEVVELIAESEAQSAGRLTVGSAADIALRGGTVITVMDRVYRFWDPITKAWSAATGAVSGSQCGNGLPEGFGYSEEGLRRLTGVAGYDGTVRPGVADWAVRHTLLHGSKSEDLARESVTCRSGYATVIVSTRNPGNIITLWPESPDAYR